MKVNFTDKLELSLSFDVVDSAFRRLSVDSIRYDLCGVSVVCLLVSSVSGWYVGKCSRVTFAGSRHQDLKETLKPCGAERQWKCRSDCNRCSS